MRRLHPGRFPDVLAEAVRRSHADAITELQQLVSARSSGRLLDVRILEGKGTLRLPTNTCVVHLRGVGQGGGGGGGGGAGSSGAGAGGTSGVMLDIWIGTIGLPMSTLTVTWICGSTGGAGGANTGGDGAAGADTTILINGRLYTMKGGGPGAGMASPGNSAASVATTAPAPGTSPGGVTTWGSGGPGIILAGQAAGFTGYGGSTPLGAGGQTRITQGAGFPGNGFGGGGGGGIGGAVGGNGAVGGAVIEVFS